MYIPKHFNSEDLDQAFAFIEENAFGQLISHVAGRIFSSHVPFLLSDDKQLVYGHLALQNPQHEELNDQEVLITFEGPHDYISPSWYERPGVPTWNYQSVHVYGKCKILTAPEKKKSIVDALTNKYESNFEKPWLPNYKESMLGAIVGFEVAMDEVMYKNKLSQNKSAPERTEIIRQLNLLGSTSLAKAMEKSS